MTRCVVVLCGPPGSGKTTGARSSGLEVFDRDDAQWVSERQFRARLGALAGARHARAVVIRSGATSSARRAAADLVRATHVFLMVEPREVLARRIVQRGRSDAQVTLAGLDTWFSRFDRLDGVPEFPGWDVVLGLPDLGVVLTDW